MIKMLCVCCCFPICLFLFLSTAMIAMLAYYGPIKDDREQCYTLASCRMEKKITHLSQIFFRNRRKREKKPSAMRGGCKKFVNMVYLICRRCSCIVPKHNDQVGEYTRCNIVIGLPFLFEKKVFNLNVMNSSEMVEAPVVLQLSNSLKK